MERVNNRDNEQSRMRELEQENRERKRVNEILKRAASFFGLELDHQYKNEWLFG